MTPHEIRELLASSDQPLHRRFEALSAFFIERRPASEVAERFGYSRSAVYNMTRDFARLEGPAAAFVRGPVPPAARWCRTPAPAQPLRARHQGLAGRRAREPLETAAVSVQLVPDGSESFQCGSSVGLLCLSPWLRRYGIDLAIEQAGIPGPTAPPALQSCWPCSRSSWPACAATAPTTSGAWTAASACSPG